VLKQSYEELEATYGNIDFEISEVRRLTIYEKRQYNHALVRTQALFDEPELIKRVWREFLDIETAKGKNTRVISQETGVPMAIINSYF